MDNLTVVVPYRDNRDALQRLIKTLPATLPLIVVDDCSEVKPPVALIQARKGARLISRETRGYFSGAVNTGISACATDVLVLNQDVWFQGDKWLAELDSLRKEHAIVGDGVVNHPCWPKGYVQGTCMFLRRDAIETVGLLDERYWPLWGATAEWQVRACRKGYKALPIANCSWFRHDRKGAYGTSIRKLLTKEPQKQALYIRTPPLISVVVACYNYGKYLRDLVASLIGGTTSLGPHPGQTFQGFEIVICDDASTDDSWKIAQALADDWKGIRAIKRGTNGGSSAALNSGILPARGKYIQIVDADDMLEPTALERMLTEIEKNPKSLVYSDMTLFADGKRGASWKMKDYDFEVLLERNHVPTGTMFTKEAWKKVGGYPPAFTNGRQDWAFAVRMGEHGYCGVHIPEQLYLYRREKQNRSLRNANQRTEFVNRMRETFPRLYEGERPMGCCGGNRKPPVTVNKVKTTITPLVGADGMVLLEYIGENVGKVTYWGPVTRATYVFGSGASKRYVDAADASAMVDIVEGRRHIFRIVAPVTPAQTIAPETLVEQPVEEELVVEERFIDDAPPDESVEAVVETTAADITTMKVTEAVEAIKSADTETLQHWFIQEQEGKGRVTVLRAISQTLGD